MLVYAHTITPRLEYACAFIFEQQLGITYILTSDEEFFKQSTEAKLNYSDSDIPFAYTIRPAPLLFEHIIQEQNIQCFQNAGQKFFFKTDASDFEFDILAATFYLLSRYEEYLPHRKDKYGRYAHEQSLAFREGFLHRPLVNQWIASFAISLRNAFPKITFKQPAFTFTPTYDIDIAWSYRNKGFMRDLGSFLLTPSLGRLRAVIQKEKDPYDCYDFLHRLHKTYELQPLYFFLVAGSRGRYDKNSDIQSQEFKALIQQHSAEYTIGLHPSWKSNDEPHLLLVEKNYLDKLLPASAGVERSRQHYLRFNLPHTFSALLQAGIRDDYSMGYGTVNGFRASVASTFYWYDLLNDRQTALRIHPFCFMDSTSLFAQKQTAEKAYTELLYYFNTCKEVQGTFITIFHNNILGGDKYFAPWPQMYQRFIEASVPRRTSN